MKIQVHTIPKRAWDMDKAREMLMSQTVRENNFGAVAGFKRFDYDSYMATVVEREPESVYWTDEHNRCAYISEITDHDLHNLTLFVADAVAENKLCIGYNHDLPKFLRVMEEECAYRKLPVPLVYYTSREDRG